MPTNITTSAQLLEDIYNANPNAFKKFDSGIKRGATYSQDIKKNLSNVYSALANPTRLSGNVLDNVYYKEAIDAIRGHASFATVADAERQQSQFAAELSPAQKAYGALTAAAFKANGTHFKPSFNINGQAYENSETGKVKAMVDYMKNNLSEGAFKIWQKQQLGKAENQYGTLQQQRDLAMQNLETARANLNKPSSNKAEPQNRARQIGQYETQLNRINNMLKEYGVEPDNIIKSELGMVADVNKSVRQGRLDRKISEGGFADPSRKLREQRLINVEDNIYRTGTGNNELKALQKERGDAGDFKYTSGGNVVRRTGEISSRDVSPNVIKAFETGRANGFEDSVIRAKLKRQGFTDSQIESGISTMPVQDLQGLRQQKKVEATIQTFEPQDQEMLISNLQSGDPRLVQQATEQINQMMSLGNNSFMFGGNSPGGMSGDMGGIQISPDMQFKLSSSILPGTNELISEATKILGNGAKPLLSLLDQEKNIGIAAAEQAMYGEIRKLVSEKGLSEAQAKKLTKMLDERKSRNYEQINADLDAFGTKVKENIESLKAQDNLDLMDAEDAKEEAIAATKAQLARLGIIDSSDSINIINKVTKEHDRLIQKVKMENFKVIQDEMDKYTTEASKANAAKRAIDEAYEDRIFKMEEDQSKKEIEINSKLWDSKLEKDQAYAKLYMDYLKKVSTMAQNKLEEKKKAGTGLLRNATWNSASEIDRAEFETAFYQAYGKEPNNFVRENFFNSYLQERRSNIPPEDFMGPIDYRNYKIGLSPLDAMTKATLRKQTGQGAEGISLDGLFD